ncbi:MAG: hypothetical protein RL117_1429 [Verrucomicrobiota bacterium]
MVPALLELRELGGRSFAVTFRVLGGLHVDGDHALW